MFDRSALQSEWSQAAARGKGPFVSLGGPKYTACPPLSSLNKLLQQQETQLTTQTLLARLFYYFDPVTQRGADKSPTSGFVPETLDSRSISRVCASPLLSQAVILSFVLSFVLCIPQRFSPGPDHKVINFRRKETLALA